MSKHCPKRRTYGFDVLIACLVTPLMMVVIGAVGLFMGCIFVWLALVDRSAADTCTAIFTIGGACIGGLIAYSHDHEKWSLILGRCQLAFVFAATAVSAIVTFA